MPTSDTRAGDLPRRFAERFELHELLGRGGMAAVYRATELGSGRQVALKQLVGSESELHNEHLVMLFEREFHTLAQLSHPRVIQVYDYGVTPEGGCYYTMELLDGRSLRDRVPLPWREACRVAFEVCSSLALLHSRRLLHRDVSPRNVHCMSDASAKLIDFGAVAPMTSGGDVVVGTPPFTAPEIVQRSATDARTDLYALGATLYFALTGQLAYPARSFAELLVSWNQRPTSPSARVAGIPRALDDLTLSLLSLEPARRPPSAFAVMQHLAAIASLESQEADSVSRAYLTTPALTGRTALLASLRQLLLQGLDSGGPGVLLWGAAPGLGRSRLLDACMLEAKTLGALVLRATARGTPQDFELAYALAEHLIETVAVDPLATQFPQLLAERAGRMRLRELAELRSEPAQLEQALVQMFRAASKTQPLVFAVDDAQRIDERSAALIALLMERFRYGRGFVLLTAEHGTGAVSPALGALVRRCASLAVAPLDLPETRELFASVFGDVPNLASIAEEIFGIARGNPRASMELAQHLVDSGVITYHAGVWTLPAALSSQQLPRSLEEAVRTRIQHWSPLARFLAQSHALSFLDRLTHEDHRNLAAGVGARAADAALDELLADGALTRDGESYVLTSRLWGAALESSLDQAGREQAHRALAALFESRSEAAWIHHVFAADSSEAEERALDALLARHARSRLQSHRELLEDDLGKLAPSYLRALEIGARRGRRARDLHELRHALLGVSVAAGDPAFYWAVAPRWLEQLVLDTGLDLWRQDAPNADAGARLGKALTAAFERHQQTPEQARGYRPDEAIPLLAEYVAISIAIGVRTMDGALLDSLPDLLAPFAPLSPLLAALWQNAVGCRECHVLCQHEVARERWQRVHTELRDASAAEVRHVTAIRNAIAYAIGMVEAVFGMPSAARWAEELDQDPYQRVNALYLRKVVRLEQGDWAGAEELQRTAEVLALRARIPQMFNATLAVELGAHSRARDLAGVKDVIQRLKLEAARFSGWSLFLREAEGRYELLRGDFAQAKSCFEQVIAATALDANQNSRCLPIWVTAQGGKCEALLGLEQPSEARLSALAALSTCEQLNVRLMAYDLVRVLALSEATLGDFTSAVARLDRLIESQTAFGVTGLRLGISYEARAEVALWSEDAAGYEHFAQLTAREYRYGANSPLGARYERLLHEAQRRGIRPGPALSDFALTTTFDSSNVSLDELRSVVRDALSGPQSESERRQRALRMICSARAARGGHLYQPTAKGLALVASCGSSPPDERLAVHAREYLEREEDRFETQTIALGAQVALETHVPIAHIDGTDYELLLLSCVTDQLAQIVGVVALAPGAEPKVHPRQAQLLASIAAQLMSRGA